MDDRLAGRLEETGARVRALLGKRPRSAGSAESSEADSGPPSAADAAILAERIRRYANVGPDAARALADGIVEQAQAALEKFEGAAANPVLTDAEALALESVIHVRARPALRVGQNALESLADFPGSELWQEFVAEYEEGMLRAAAATGAVVVSLFGSGNPPWVEGSAWLVAPNRVLTNRHVVLSEELQLVRADPHGDGMRLAPNAAIAIDFAADDRSPPAAIRRKVTGVLYVAPPQDPVDIAVLEIETIDAVAPLGFMADGAAAPRNIFVVGHPAPLTLAPAAVKAVFGNFDSRKRVSFGKLLNPAPSARDILHDASTVGGYSGAPVVGISGGTVAGLHYYGDPASGNLAISAAAVRAHAAHQYCVAS